MKEFIEVTKIGQDGEKYRTILSVSAIISITEIGGEVFIQYERSKDGKIRVGMLIDESYEKIRSLLCLN